MKNFDHKSQRKAKRAGAITRLAIFSGAAGLWSLFHGALLAASARMSTGGGRHRKGQRKTSRGGSHLARHTHNPAGTKLAAWAGRNNKPRGW